MYNVCFKCIPKQNLIESNTLTQSPNGSSLPSLCSPNSLSPEDEFAFMSMKCEDGIDLTMRAPYIPMNENDDLPLLTEDLMWSAFSEELCLQHKDMKEAMHNDAIKESSLASLLSPNCITSSHNNNIQQTQHMQQHDQQQNHQHQHHNQINNNNQHHQRNTQIGYKKNKTTIEQQKKCDDGGGGNVNHLDHIFIKNCKYIHLIFIKKNIYRKQTITTVQ